MRKRKVVSEEILLTDEDIQNVIGGLWLIVKAGGLLGTLIGDVAAFFVAAAYGTIIPIKQAAIDGNIKLDEQEHVRNEALKKAITTN